jgi:hypothetical protein
MKRKTAIIFLSLALLTVLGFYLPGLVRADGCPTPGSVLNREVIRMDNGDTICLVPDEDCNNPCPTVVDCGSGLPLNSNWIENVLTATPVGGEGGSSPVGYAGTPGQTCPKIVLRAADVSLGATWVCVGGKCFYR